MKLAYTAGQYRNPELYGVVTNIRRAELVAIELWRLGIPTICPHKNTALLDGSLYPGDSDVWLKGDLEMLRRCDCVVMIPGWEQSEGAKAEKEFAVEHNIPIFYWPMDKEELAMFRG